MANALEFTTRPWHEFGSEISRLKVRACAWGHMHVWTQDSQKIFWKVQTYSDRCRSCLFGLLVHSTCSWCLSWLAAASLSAGSCVAKYCIKVVAADLRMKPEHCHCRSGLAKKFIYARGKLALGGVSTVIILAHLISAIIPSCSILIGSWLSRSMLIRKS